MNQQPKTQRQEPTIRSQAHQELSSAPLHAPKHQPKPNEKRKEKKKEKEDRRK